MDRQGNWHCSCPHWVARLQGLGMACKHIDAVMNYRREWELLPAAVDGKGPAYNPRDVARCALETLIQYGKESQPKCASRGEALGYAVYALGITSKDAPLEDEVREIVEMCKEGLEQWNGHLERATLDAIQKRAYVRRGRKLTITLPECWRGMKSRAYLQWKSCRSKMRYSTRHEAESAAERQGKEHGIIFRVYPCNLCHGYHMTHAKERSGYAAD
jgi:hypothetical protein